MRVVNVSLLRFNDTHSYYGGAIGNIAYNLVAALAELDDVEVFSFTGGLDIEGAPPEDLHFVEADSFEDVGNRMREYIDDETVLTHLYFHEPEYTPLADTLRRSANPFVIGMCEPPHYRRRDEVDWPLKVPFARTIGKHLLYMPRFKRTISACDRLVTVNEHGQEYYGEYVPDTDVRVVPYGVDHDLFEYAELPEEPRVLMVTRLIKRRDVDSLIEAIPVVAEVIPSVQVDIVGDGPRRSRLEELAERNGSRSRIEFHGNVSPEGLVERYRKCSVFCHLSASDGWNQPALEAMATGRPVVAVDAPHNDMIVDGETGYLVPRGDSDVLAEHLVSLLEDEEATTAFGRAGRRLAEERYDWSSIAKRYRTIFREVLIDDST